MAKTSKRQKTLAAKRAAKAARFAARRDPKEANTPYALRKKARERGVPMSSRTHEGRPWWLFLSPIYRPASVPREFLEAA